MIKIKFVYESNFLHEFKINGHAPDYICSAVSVLVINTVNSIEKFTNDNFFCDYNKKGGRFYFRFKHKSISRDSKILVSALELGLRNICKEYKKFVSITEVKI